MSNPFIMNNVSTQHLKCLHDKRSDYIRYLEAELADARSSLNQIKQAMENKND